MFFCFVKLGIVILYETIGAPAGDKKSAPAKGKKVVEEDGFETIEAADW